MTSTTRPASGMTRPSSLGIRPISAETRPTWPVDRGIAQAIRPGPRSSRPLFLPTPVASPPATACALPLSPSHRSWQSSYRPPQWTPAYDRPGSLRHPPIASVETTRHFFSSYFRLFLSTFSPCPDLVPRSIFVLARRPVRKLEPGLMNPAFVLPPQRKQARIRPEDPAKKAGIFRPNSR